MDAIKESKFKIDTVISGGARGADSLGERWANENKKELLRFPADWGKYGRAAGHIRNAEMAKNADALIAIWDGESRGTKDMINKAKKHGLQIYIFYTKGK